MFFQNWGSDPTTTVLKNIHEILKVLIIVNWAIINWWSLELTIHRPEHVLNLSIWGSLIHLEAVKVIFYWMKNMTLN